MTAPLIVFGSGGQLGRELVDLAIHSAENVVACARAEVDIADPDAVASALRQARPRLIVNVAAYTAVDKAESDVAGATASNVTGPQVLGSLAEQFEIPLVHVSTDYVFGGDKTGPYVETDPIAPIGVYGRTKAEGEARLLAAARRHVVIRTSWVYGAHGANFLKTILRLARERDELRVVADQRGCPTATLDLAKAILAIDALIATGAEPWGVYHFAGARATTWQGFASEIVEAAADHTGRRPKISPIATQDYPTPARRPVNSELDSSRFASVFGYRAAPWRTRVREVVRSLLQPVA